LNKGGTKNSKKKTRGRKTWEKNYITRREKESTLKPTKRPEDPVNRRAHSNKPKKVSALKENSSKTDPRKKLSTAADAGKLA